MQIEEAARQYVRQQEDTSEPIDINYLRELTGWKPPAINLIIQQAMREENDYEQRQRLRGLPKGKGGAKKGQAVFRK